MPKSLKPSWSSVWLFMLTLAVALPGQESTGSSAAAARQQVYNLSLPPRAGPDEALVARVSVGPLKPHLRIIVRIRNGEIAGTISPFGAQARQGPAVYTIPLPASARKDSEVRLLVEVEQKGAETRAPTSDEVQRIELAWMPVTKSGKE